MNTIAQQIRKFKALQEKKSKTVRDYLIEYVESGKKFIITYYDGHGIIAIGLPTELLKSDSDFMLKVKNSEVKSIEIKSAIYILL